MVTFALKEVLLFAPAFIVIALRFRSMHNKQVQYTLSEKSHANAFKPFKQSSPTTERKGLLLLSMRAMNTLFNHKLQKKFFFRLWKTFRFVKRINQIMVESQKTFLHSYASFFSSKLSYKSLENIVDRVFSLLSLRLLDSSIFQIIVFVSSECRKNGKRGWNMIERKTL